MVLVCLEGPNGVGKSTLAAAVRAELRQPGIEVTIVTDTLVSLLAQARGDTPAAYRAAREMVTRHYGLADTSRRVVILERWHLTTLVFDHWNQLRQGTMPCLSTLLPVMPDLTYLLTADMATLRSRHQDRLRRRPGFTLGLPLIEQVHRYRQVAVALETPMIQSSDLAVILSRIKGYIAG